MFKIYLFRNDGDYNVSYNNGYGIETIDFNICGYTARTCLDGVQDYANRINHNNTCSHMSDDDISDITVSLIDLDKPWMGLVLTMMGNVVCNETSNNGLTL